MQHDTTTSRFNCLPVNTALRPRMLETSNRQLPAALLSCHYGVTVLRIRSRDGLRPPYTGPIGNVIHEQKALEYLQIRLATETHTCTRQLQYSLRFISFTELRQCIYRIILYRFWSTDVSGDLQFVYNLGFKHVPVQIVFVNSSSLIQIQSLSNQ